MKEKPRKKKPLSTKKPGRPRKHDSLVMYEKHEKIINAAWKKRNPTLLNRYVNPILVSIEKELQDLPKTRSLHTTRYLLEDLARVLRIYQIQAYEPKIQEDPMVIDLDTSQRKPHGIESSGSKIFTPYEKKVSEASTPNFSSDCIEELNKNENDENPQIDQNEAFFPRGKTLPDSNRPKNFPKVEISDSPWEKTLEEQWGEWEGEEEESDEESVSKEYIERGEEEGCEWEDVGEGVGEDTGEEEDEEEVGGMRDEAGETNEEDEVEEERGEGDDEGGIDGLGGVVEDFLKEDGARDMRDVFPTTSTFSHPVQSATSAPAATSAPEVPIPMPDIMSAPNSPNLSPTATPSPYDELLNIDVSGVSLSESPPPEIFPPEEKVENISEKNTPENFSSLDKTQRVMYKLRKWKEEQDRKGEGR